MKAIKIASGVAITALALAISAQANAAAHEGGNTEFSWNATGSMDASLFLNSEAAATNNDGDTVDTTVDVDLDQEDDFDSGVAGEAWGLETNIAVMHGPFSANIDIVAGDASGSANTTVGVDDIIVTDGAFSFGQVSELVDLTDGYAYDMGDSDDVTALTGGDDGKSVGAGFRYTMDGLKVQVEGQDETSDYGLGAQYSGEADALSYVAELQYRASSLDGDDDNAYVYVGGGVTYTMDMVMVKAAANQYTLDAGGNANEDSILEFGFEVVATPIEAASLYVKGVNWDAGENFDDATVNDTAAGTRAKYLFGAAYTVDMLTFTGEYVLTTNEDAGDEVFGEVAYASGPLGAYGSVTLANIEADTADAPLFEAGVSYTQDNGVVYAADYDLRAEETGATVNQSAISVLQLSAAYAF